MSELTVFCLLVTFGLQINLALLRKRVPPSEHEQELAEWDAKFRATRRRP